MNFLDQGFQKLEHYRRTDRHTNRRDRTHYHVAFAGRIYSYSYTGIVKPFQRRRDSINFYRAAWNADAV